MYSRICARRAGYTLGFAPFLVRSEIFAMIEKLCKSGSIRCGPAELGHLCYGLGWFGPRKLDQRPTRTRMVWLLDL